MNLKEFNSLTDLFFYQADKQNPNLDFLEWLNPKNKKKYTWGETSKNIQKFAIFLKDILKEGDRCLLVSENRPEWLICDLAIMLSDGITVPAYTTYTEKDYKYLIEDCQPSVIIVSNDEMHKKLKKIIQEKEFIKKVITFDEIKNVEQKDKYLTFESIVNNKINKNEIKKNKNMNKEQDQKQDSKQDQDNKEDKKDQNSNQNENQNQNQNDNKKNNSNNDENPNQDESPQVDNNESNQNQEIQSNQSAENILNALKENEKVNKKRKQKKSSQESVKDW